MSIELHTILINGKDPVVLGLGVEIGLGTTPGTVNAKVLPYEGAPKGQLIPNLPIVNGILNIPLKILFASYAREDEEAVLPLVEKLMADGYSCWIDQKQILPGDRWEAKIEQAIPNTQFALVFLSSKSVKKVGYVQREWRLIQKQASYRPNTERYLIPIKLDDCEVPLEFQEYNWLEIWKPNAYQRLLQAIR